MGTHTAGPLIASGNEVWKLLSDNSGLTLQVARCAGSDAESEANAKLYASAPDLLEAAKLAEDIIDDFLGHLSPDDQVACAEDPKAATALKALRAAIRRAQGEGSE